MRILFFGDDRIGKNALERLVRDGHEMCGVVLRSAPVNGDVESAARALGLSVHQPVKVNDAAFLATATACRPDLIVSVNYNQILRAGLLSLAPKGAVNVHNGLLPDFGGGGGLYGAVINEQTTFGQTAHYMNDQIDSGNILVQRTYPILPSDTMQDLVARAAEGIGDTISEAVRLAEAGDAGRPQRRHGSYFPRKPEGDEIIDWSEPARLLLDKIRARRPGPGNITYMGDRRLIVWKAAACDVPDYRGPVGQVIGRTPSGVLVKAGDSAILVEEIQFDGEPVSVPRMPVGTCFLANWRQAFLELRAGMRDLERQVADLRSAAAVPRPSQGERA